MRPLLLAPVLALCLLACSDDSGPAEDGGTQADVGNLNELGIKPFQPSDRITLVEGQSFYVTVRLNLEVTATTYIDVINDHQEFIQAEPPTLQYVYGDQEKKVNFTGLKPTSGQYKTIRFNIRGTSVERTFDIMVTEEVVPDAGL